MKEEKITVKEVVSREKTVYIAFDGKEFSDEYACMKYEQKTMLKQLKESKNLKYYEEAENWIFPTYNDYSSEAEFYYFKVLNKEGAEEIIKYLCETSPETFSLENSYGIDPEDVICIYYDPFNDGEASFVHMEYIKKDVDDFFAMFD